MGRPRGSGKGTPKPNKYANESKPDKFVRVGTLRLNKALGALDALAKAARSKAMEFNDEQAAFILDQLRNGISAVESAFTTPVVVAGKPKVELPK
jgi:hypothetical protein